MAGCSSSPPIPSENHPLVGSWVWDSNTTLVYVFERSGEGTRSADAVQGEAFTWTTNEDGLLSITIEDEGTEEWDYAVDGRVLILTSEHYNVERTYIRIYVEPEPQNGPLVGTWAWDGNPEWTYVFEANGQGVRGTEENPEPFEWWTTDDSGVLMHLGLRVDRWTYTVSGDILTITSRQEAGLAYTFIRAS